MLIKSLTPNDLKIEEEFSKKFVDLKTKGICATCYHRQHGGVFIEIEGAEVYQDELFEVFFASNPRREGHIIVSTKKHYEDISELPSELGSDIMKLMLVVINAQKAVLKAKKVYMVTMCDEGKTHLHFQLIPNYEGMKHGKHVFVAERQLFNYDVALVNQIKQLIKSNYKPDYTNEYIKKYGVSE